MGTPWDLNYHRLAWLLLFTGFAHGFTDTNNWESFVSKFGLEYPSLNNRWTVDSFVGSRKSNNFRYMEAEFSRLTNDAQILRDQFQMLGVNGTEILKTVNSIEEFLNRWKAIMFLLEKVFDTASNGTLPIEKMRSAAAAQMKILFNEAAHDLPALFVKINNQIHGRDVPEGQSNPVCMFVSKKIEHMVEVTESPVGIKLAVNQSQDFLEQLMKLQVRAALLYDMTCAPEDIPCRQRIVTLERDLQAQNKLFKMCTPMLMYRLARTSVADDIYLAAPFTNKILYMVDSETVTSSSGNIHISGLGVKGNAVKCAKRTSLTRDPSIWSLEDASPHGMMGFFLRGNDGCYVGVDRTIVNFIGDELQDPKAGGAENDEVLLCRLDVKPHARITQTFMIEPVSANYSTTYMLKNVLTKKYLRAVRTNIDLVDKATDGHMVNLVLQQCGHSHVGCTWHISEEAPECLVHSNNSFVDMFIMKLYLLLMGVLFIMLIASLIVICLYRKQIRRDYLQYRRVNQQDVIIPPSYRFPSRT